MSPLMMFFMAVLGFGIAILVFKVSDRRYPAIVICMMSIALVLVGFSGYREIRDEAGIYYPLAVQWLENHDGSQVPTENYRVHCVYFNPDKSVAVVYVELPAAQEDIVMTFKRAVKALEGVHFISKDRKPLPDLNNKINPDIYFYEKS